MKGAGPIIPAIRGLVSMEQYLFSDRRHCSVSWSCEASVCPSVPWSADFHLFHIPPFFTSANQPFPSHFQTSWFDSQPHLPDCGSPSLSQIPEVYWENICNITPQRTLLRSSVFFFFFLLLLRLIHSFFCSHFALLSIATDKNWIFFTWTGGSLYRCCVFRHAKCAPTQAMHSLHLALHTHHLPSKPTAPTLMRVDGVGLFALQ